MIRALIVVCTLLCQAVTGQIHVHLGEREWYGGICEERALEVEIDGRWYESTPITCGGRS